MASIGHLEFYRKYFPTMCQISKCKLTWLRSTTVAYLFDANVLFPGDPKWSKNQHLVWRLSLFPFVWYSDTFLNFDTVEQTRRISCKSGSKVYWTFLGGCRDFSDDRYGHQRHRRNNRKFIRDPSIIFRFRLLRFFCILSACLQNAQPLNLTSSGYGFATCLLKRGNRKGT